VLRPWKSAAAEKGLQWEVELPETMPEIQADTVRLTQIVGNLASNAIRYTPRGGFVRISCGVENGQACIRFKDSGAGIAPQDQEKIFQPFYKGEQGKRIKEGMGLGLAIARDLVEAHGGTIQLESAPGSGSTFTVWLPLVGE